MSRRETTNPGPWMTKTLPRGPLGSVIRYKASSHWMDFELFLVAAQGKDGAPSFETGELRLKTYTEDLDLACPLFDGFIKWDGCMQFGPGEDPANGYPFHVDDWEDTKDFGEHVLDIRRLAAQVISAWDASLEGPQDG